MKNFSENELEEYLTKISDETLFAYNVYQIEGEGRNLFASINGDEDTIMGLPIKKIKEYLKIHGIKRYFVIGNPINHSLSPKLQNYWIKQHNINAIYEKIKLEENEIESFIIRQEPEIDGCNIRFRLKKGDPFLDKLSSEAEKTQSVNTIINNGEINWS